MTGVPDDKITKSLDLEKKVDLLLEQQQAIQRAVALFKGDLPKIIEESILAILSKRAAKGMP